MTDKQLLKSKRKYEKLKTAHLEKLKRYREDPFGCDHLGVLKDKTPAEQQRSIQGRIDALNKQIKKHVKELIKIDAILKDRGLR